MDRSSGISNSTAQPFNDSPGSREEKRVLEASQGFEAYFIQQIIQEMRKTIPKTEKPGFGNAIYESMMDQALSQKISEQNGIGLARQIHDTLLARGKK
jgi:flagellar protein FlgJ